MIKSPLIRLFFLFAYNSYPELLYLNKSAFDRKSGSRESELVVTTSVLSQPRSMYCPTDSDQEPEALTQAPPPQAPPPQEVLPQEMPPQEMPPQEVPDNEAVEVDCVEPGAMHCDTDDEEPCYREVPMDLGMPSLEPLKPRITRKTVGDELKMLLDQLVAGQISRKH